MIFLVYNPAAAGHSDAAIPYSCTVTQNKPQDSLRKESRVSCSCGVNKKIDQKSCAPNPIYATRCKCFAQCKPCSSSCCCKNCSNPFGTQPEKPIGVKRQRRSHSMQITLPTSKRFAEDKGEEMSTSVWSSFESILLREIIKESKKDQSIVPHKIYNDVVYYANSNFCTIHSMK